ncbi:GTP pyrophosphokinase (plasmid) [Priestia megaterium]|uniref:GTP pyrophosphokinase n=1 Tax=Priestia megaterium TaxID=1404 RepID=UPI003D01B85E
MKNPINDLKQQYEYTMPTYNKLGTNLTEAIEMLLQEHSIEYLKVYHRTKETDSFMEKIDRKEYNNPFEEIEDICGIRIICYYQGDIEKVCKIIDKEFTVLESQNKEGLLGTKEFGYRSHHFIVKVKEEWLVTPNYKGLEDLKAEIQIRTVLMHTWAEIEHELGYKNKENLHPDFERKFSLLSAMLEQVDHQFEELKESIVKYRDEKTKEAQETGWLQSQSMEDMNIDTFQVFLDESFPDRKKSPANSVSELLTQLKEYKLSYSILNEWYMEYKDVLPEIEEETSYPFYRGRKIWDQVGVVRMLMFLNIPEFVEKARIPLSLRKVISRHK